MNWATSDISDKLEGSSTVLGRCLSVHQLKISAHNITSHSIPGIYDLPLLFNGNMEK
jgi:hypothetical protein